MRSFYRILFAICASLSVVNAAEAEEGTWISLFDGKTTKGWVPREEVVTFEAKEGELHLHAEKNVWVTSALGMNHFEAELEVLLPKDASETKFNSGFAFRCLGDSGKPKGYQCEIDGAKPGKSGGVFGIGLGGWLFPKTKDDQAVYGETIAGVVKSGMWNHYRVRCVGPRIQTWVNGTLITDIEDSQSLGGFFGIQHHGKGGLVKFRNIRARELPSPSPETKAGKVPNLIWITAEDMSPTLGCYGDQYATTPHLDQFAKESVRYTNAFAVSPVCSPSRSCLITGMYPASMGTNQMRSSFPIPSGVHGFPSYLRKAGFFTTNNVKTDYNNADANRLIEESWDESSATAHWRNDGRKKDQPFFAVFNDMTSHQSRTMVWPYQAFQDHIQSRLSAEEIHDPEQAPIPPYYPDTEIVRKTVARFYDCVSVMDKNVGRILHELEEDGLAEDTIVFFYSDHGSGMPRHKRLLHDSGMKVPLMIRFPKKYQHLAPANPGETIDRLVSFVDFPPTVLALLGQSIPEYMQGQVFLGSEAAEEKEYIYGSRDRVDEVHETSRSIRSKKYLYIRNFQPHLSWNQPSVFSDLGEIRREITKNAQQGKEALSNAQWAYAGTGKAIEEFYNCEADPDNVHNLLTAEDSLNEEAKNALEAHRAAFAKKRMEILDVGALPETVAMRYVREEEAPLRNVMIGDTHHRPDLDSAWKAADLVGSSQKEVILEQLRVGDPVSRYWAILAMRHNHFADESIHDALYDYMDDHSADVRIETASWLAHASEEHRETALKVLSSGLEIPDWWTALRACRAIELLGEKASPLLPTMQKLYDSTRHEPGDENFFLAFSAGAYLDKLGGKTDPWDFTPKAGSFSADPPPKKK